MCNYLKCISQQMKLEIFDQKEIFVLILFMLLDLIYIIGISWRRWWHPTPVLLPGESHGWRSLVGYSPWGRKQSDMTEWLHFHFSLSCIGEGNGNPLQCSCLENPRDGGAWWAAVYGVARSRTRLKRLSSSSIGISIVYFPSVLDHTTVKKIKSMDSSLRLSGFMFRLYHLLIAWP